MKIIESVPTNESKVSVRKRLLKGASVALLATTLAVGCSDGDKAEPVPTTTTTEAPSTTTTTTKQELTQYEKEMQRREKAVKYAESSDRTNRMAFIATAYGREVIEAAETGEIGYFDFYNVQTGNWGKDGNEGWGHLQHNPQYGGSPDQVSVFVYQNADGSIDVEKGIHSLMVKLQDSDTSVEITSPDYSYINSNVSVDTSWRTTLATLKLDEKLNDIRNSAATDAYDRSAAELRAIDDEAINSLTTQMKALGLEAHGL